MVWPGVDRNADPLLAYTADAHGLAAREVALSQEFRSSRSVVDFPPAWKREQLFNRHLELAREPQGYFGVGDIGSGFNRIDGLPGNVHFFRQFRGPNSAGLSYHGQIVLNARHLFPHLNN